MGSGKPFEMAIENGEDAILCVLMLVSAYHLTLHSLEEFIKSIFALSSKRCLYLVIRNYAGRLKG